MIYFRWEILFAVLAMVAVLSIVDLFTNHRGGPVSIVITGVAGYFRLIAYFGDGVGNATQIPSAIIDNCNHLHLFQILAMISLILNGNFDNVLPRDNSFHVIIFNKNMH